MANETGTTRDIGRIGIWSGALDGHPTAKAQEAAAELESLGFGTLWIPEAVGRDPFVSSANLLAATTTLRLATGIANIYARDPMTMAACQKTLAEAYPGRFLLGLGVSHAHLVERVRKHDYSKPYSYMKEYLAAMDEALFMAHGPEDDGGVVIAALGPKMLKLSVDQADGSHPYFTTPDHTATAREIMGAKGLLAPEQMVVMSDDPATAREIGRKGMAVYMRAPNYLNSLKRLGFTDDDFADGGSDKLVDGIVAWGGLDKIAARVKEHHDAGADHVCVQVLTGEAAIPLSEWRELAGIL